MKFQDELESGRREKNNLVSVTEQVEQYRQKLLERVSRILVWLLIDCLLFKLYIMF